MKLMEWLVTYLNLFFQFLKVEQKTNENSISNIPMGLHIHRSSQFNPRHWFIRRLKIIEDNTQRIINIQRHDLKTQRVNCTRAGCRHWHYWQYLQPTLQTVPWVQATLIIINNIDHNIFNARAVISNTFKTVNRY